MANDNPTLPKQHPADQLYNRMVDIFGTGANELFVLEWPARALDSTSYAYDVSSVYSGLMKPQPVIEAEFRLSDGMIDVAPIVGGPNGQQVSVAAAAALNQLVPAYTEVVKAFQADRQTIRDWLVEIVEAKWIDEAGIEQDLKASRVEVFDALNDRYERARAAWDLEKTERLAAAESAANPTLALEGYAKWLAETAPAREGELESLFTDLVVKGFYHEVRSAIASLDLSTPAEALEDAKFRMRTSGMSSLDESETIYPVSFSPQDWFKGLSTNFQPEDLLMDPAAIQADLIQKQQQIAQLEEQVTFLRSTQTGSVADLQKLVDNAQAALDNALTNLSNSFASNVLTVARMYFGTVDPSKATTEGLDKALEESGLEGGLTNEQWKALQDGFTAVNTAQQNLTTAGRNLVDLQAALMAAKTSDSSTLIASLQTQIAQLQQQIQLLQNTLYSSEGKARLQKLATVDATGAVTYDPAKDPNYTPKVGTTPSSYTMLPTPMPAPGDWFDVIFSFSKKDSSSTSHAAASASQLSWDVDLFFGSASGSSQSSSSDTEKKMTVSDLDMKVGFRAMKVAIDRGGWLNPTAFTMSSEMYNLGPADEAGYKRFSHGEPRNPDDPKAPFDYTQSYANEEFRHLRDAVFPAFPTSFLIVKDVTITIAMADSASASAAASTASSSSYSGGLFCFSVSGSSSSSDNSASAFSSGMDSDLIIKIPGPQILGWFLEYVAEDQSTPYQQMPPDFFPKTKPTVTGVPAAVETLTLPNGAGDLSPEAIALEQAVRSEVHAVLADAHANGSAG
jgi:uncharacterized protein YlxW (UPF0749 family)